MPVSQLFWRISKWSFVAFLLVAVLFVVTLVAVPHRSENHGSCYWTDRLLPVIDCPTVANRRVVEFVLNFPYAALFLPLFALAALAKTKVWIFVLAVVDGAVILVALLYPLRLIYLKWLPKNAVVE